MSALKDVRRNPHLNVYNKYLLFRAIPMNLLLFRRILDISMGQVNGAEHILRRTYD
jgi:hypothetical protein